MYRYFSLGAHAAVRLSPPTTPAVYMAALATSGPTGNKKNKFKKRQEKKITHDTNQEKEDKVDITNTISSKFVVQRLTSKENQRGYCCSHH